MYFGITISIVTAAILIVISSGKFNVLLGLLSDWVLNLGVGILAKIPTPKFKTQSDNSPSKTLNFPDDITIRIAAVTMLIVIPKYTNFLLFFNIYLALSPRSSSSFCLCLNFNSKRISPNFYHEYFINTILSCI